ncbi:hypothetical protein [Metallibacterium scheffleri]|uniref:hypothetical protein n=1 Tax=Metallibacterium scheffleri TaxID=993689 RepID=UPI0023F33CF5|nr:hypothetical protein [Metallibacterium scheffleri]
MKNAIIKFLKQKIYFQLLETVLAAISAVSISLLLYDIIFVMPLALKHGMPYATLVISFTIFASISGAAIYLLFKILTHGIAKAASKPARSR